MTNLILCGGFGSRLWPLSRMASPKQFIKINNPHSLYQQTILRNKAVSSRIMTILGGEHYYLAKNQLEELGLNDASCEFLVEPIGRNTAPAIALACMKAGRDEFLIVTPSDHRIKNIPAYQEALKRARELAEQGFLVTFGLNPLFAETGFGYIEAGGEDVISFCEKPDTKTAEEYVNSGKHFWNSGIFCFQSGTFLDELHRLRPDVFDATERAWIDLKKRDEILIDKKLMKEIPSVSIDYAVLEKSDRVKVVCCEIGWGDFGSFDSFLEENQGNETYNLIINTTDVLAENSYRNLIAGSGRKIALIDIEGLIVADTPDALLICKRGSSQKVKNIVEKLDLQNSPLTQFQTRVERPWGTFVVLEDKPGYKVKRVEIKPGCRMSLQRHKYRSEHWTIVNGTCRIILNDQTIKKCSGDFQVIPQGAIHRLENCGDDMLIVVEIQMGSYLGEDDIERIEDDYKRF